MSGWGLLAAAALAAALRARKRQETSRGPHAVASGVNPCQFPHGWVFDVPAVGLAKPVPRKDIDTFSHEA